MNKQKSKKNFIYIGGSEPQIDGILCAKLSGLNVIVTDRSLNAPANKIADKFENIEANDIQGLIKLALELNRDNDFVGAYGVADYAYEAIGEIYDKLKLPYGSKNIYTKMSDKSISREIWNSKNINIPKGVLVSNKSINIKNLRFPVVVKPSNSYNSQGLKTVSKHEDLSNAMNNAFEYSECVILEELIKGRHFNVDMVFVNGEAFKAGITERFFDCINHQALYGIQGIEFLGINESKLYDFVIRACKAIGVNYGPVTADIIFKDNTFYILEISPHFHAISISSILKLDNVLKGWFSYLASYNNWKKFMRYSVVNYSAYYYILSENQGVIAEVQGLNFVKSLNGFVSYNLKYSEGSKIKKLKDEKIYCGMILLKADTYKEIYENINLLEKKIRVITYEK